ncbi:MAG TPA: transcription-repair coupling factor [Rhabdochlamydiaceae bacterium]|jgi:transcription-repair coupling factor (superfamily II helicase)
MAIDKNSAQLLKSPSLQQFTALISQEPSLLVEQLWDAAKAALVSIIATSLPKHILVISSGSEDRLYEDLSYFSLPAVVDFPAWEILPGEDIPPSPDLVGKRFEVLHSLQSLSAPHVILAPLQAALQKLPSPATLQARCSSWKKGQTLSFTALPEQLERLGFQRRPIVADKGEFAVRGGIVDLFPLSSPDPFRLEFFGDQIEEIRTFDPISQKSTGKRSEIFLSPASEMALLQQEKKLASLLDYLGPNTLIIFNDLLALEDRYVELQSLSGAKSPYFLSLDAFFSESQKLTRHFWTQEKIQALSDVEITKKVGRDFYTGKTPLQPLAFQVAEHCFKSKRWMHPFHQISDTFSLSENIAAATEDEILHAIGRFSQSALQLHFLCASEAEENSLKEKVTKEKITLPHDTRFSRGYLSAGFFLEDAQLALLPMTEFSKRLKPRRQKWRSTSHTPASEFHALVPGDVIVHFHHGIGKFLGIEKRPDHLGTLTEFMILEYADNSKLYVPVSQSHLVSRYIGSQEEIPTLSQIGSNRWQRTRAHAQQAIIGYADQLLRMNAERIVQGGYPFPIDSEEIGLFAADFPFVETEDQLQAIAAISQDMHSPKAMDRLICGDVGYGKTEVAMRAAFKAVVDGKKQVAVLVPTTLLAMQHYETFSARMANYPINIGVLSRFRSRKEILETLKKAKEGTIDIVIGTHRIISKDVSFKDLGLIIIDEEQRFGVRAKEHLKKIKVGVDCLTLSATPIPRTLYLSLVGSKDISVINTPPQDRLPIKSIIAEKDPSLVQNALMRELSRDGQAFFIHNRIESIFWVTEEIQKMLPEARIVTGHGQMSAEEIDAVFHAFKSGQADILVATTIIENGIDIPNANTILIDRSDTFGLADLYQMRGRVGRWNRPAYAYFLVPKHASLPELTRRRLYALVEASGYGAGMKIAMRDLEIRGAGDILGTQQSGQISSIGFHLYCKLLKKAIDALGKRTSPSFTEPKIEFPFDAALPDFYINESSLRMELYHRFGEATTHEELDALLLELKDRFGPYPEQVLWLYHLTRLRIFASQHHFILLKCEPRSLLAERQVGTKTHKQTLLLPKAKTPAEWEASVTSVLAQAFGL